MVEEIPTKTPQLERDTDAVIAAERLYGTFKELVNAGFTPQDAILYLGTLVATLTHLKNQSKGLSDFKRGFK